MKKLAMLVLCAVLPLLAQGSSVPKSDITFQIRRVVTCRAEDHPVNFRGDSIPYCLSDVIVDQAGIASAQPYKDPLGRMGMRLHFTPKAAETLRRKVALHDELAFVIDGETVLHLLVMDEISSEAVISGDFAKAEINGWIARLAALARKRQSSGKA